MGLVFIYLKLTLAFTLLSLSSLFITFVSWFETFPILVFFKQYYYNSFKAKDKYQIDKYKSVKAFLEAFFSASLFV